MTETLSKHASHATFVHVSNIHNNLEYLLRFVYRIKIKVYFFPRLEKYQLQLCGFQKKGKVNRKKEQKTCNRNQTPEISPNAFPMSKV